MGAGAGDRMRQGTAGSALAGRGVLPEPPSRFGPFLTEAELAHRCPLHEKTHAQGFCLHKKKGCAQNAWSCLWVRRRVWR
jgi:hypothetical protein